MLHAFNTHTYIYIHTYCMINKYQLDEGTQKFNVNETCTSCDMFFLSAKSMTPPKKTQQQSLLTTKQLLRDLCTRLCTRDCDKLHASHGQAKPWQRQIWGQEQVSWPKFLGSILSSLADVAEFLPDPTHVIDFDNA